MKPWRLYLPVLAAMVLGGGCVQTPSRPAWRYLQRASVRVAIVPAGNDVISAPGAQIVIDKAWEETLQGAGFQVVNADSMVTYAASGNGRVSDLTNLPTEKLGREVHADFLLENRITAYSTKYQVINAETDVACESRLVEARTGALVWRWDWMLRDNGGNDNSGGVVGLLVKAAVTAISNSMFDVTARLAKQGVAMAGRTQPYPGIAPITPPDR